MAVRDVLRMGDPRLLEQAKPVERFGTPELDALLEDMHDTMAALDGADTTMPFFLTSTDVAIAPYEGTDFDNSFCTSEMFATPAS